MTMYYVEIIIRFNAVVRCIAERHTVSEPRESHLQIGTSHPQRYKWRAVLRSVQSQTLSLQTLTI
jgi:hypothetical protein